MPGMQLRELELKTFRQEPVVGVYARQHRPTREAWPVHFETQSIPLL